MATIHKGLFAALASKTGLSRAPLYARIQQTANKEALPRDLAAIKLAAEQGVNINKYATAAQLAELRSAGAPVTPPSAGIALGVAELRVQPKPRGRATTSSKRNRPNQVFVVHGRDRIAKDSMFALLSALGVKPLEWNGAIGKSKKASPYVGQILDAAFKHVRAVVVLLTPDDQVQLRSDLVIPSDKPYERSLTGQARPNVLFEAGMAFATHPDQTLLVQIGYVKEFSDIGGRHLVNLTNEFEARQQFVTKLQNAGCEVDTTGAQWTRVGDFSDPLARTPKVAKRKKYPARKKKVR